LLVAPIAPHLKSRAVVLPAGRWYDFHTGAYAGENESVTVSPALGEIPLFVRDGALIPMLSEARQHIPRKGESVSLEIRHYGEKPGSLVLYDDDGETFAYERGEYSWTNLEVSRQAGGGWQGKVAADPVDRGWSYADVAWTYMTP
jgi:alpha-D-xyloside xylohydrolase